MLDACRAQVEMQQQQQQRVLLGRRGRSRVGLQHLPPREGAGSARPQQQQQQQVAAMGGQGTVKLGTCWRSWGKMAQSECGVAVCAYKGGDCSRVTGRGI